MQPVILVYSETNESNIASRLGLSEYSYYFVLKWFVPVLAKLGEVKIIHDPLVEADVEYEQAVQQGRHCVLFSFAPPHRTLEPQRCPVVPLVAWEFERIPDYAWDESDPRSDWRYVLERAGMVITHSEFARQAIARAMPAGYPVWSIPAPVWDRFSARGKRLNHQQGRMPGKGLDVRIKGRIFDSAQHIPGSLAQANEQRAIEQAARDEAARVEAERIKAEQAIDPVVAKRMRRAARRKRSLQKFLARLRGQSLAQFDPQPVQAPAQPQPPVQQPADHHIQARGIVYASILNPLDGRKNLWDIVTAFAACFQDVEGAVLVLKLNDADGMSTFAGMEFQLRKFTWLKCRIIAFNGYLEDDNYEQFLGGIDYVVNASTGEGQCLPLMELMSMGTPAIAPAHTSMADYITPDNAFILPSTRYLTRWPQDPSAAYTTLAFNVPWDALRDSYKRSFDVARSDDPQAYQYMSVAAMRQLEKHCSERVVLQALSDALQHQQTALRHGQAA